MHPVAVILAAIGSTVLTWAATSLGAATVFVVPRLRRDVLSALLALSAGVMLTAALASLWIPAVHAFAGQGLPGGATTVLVAGLGAALTWWLRRRLVGDRHQVGPLLFGAMSAHHVPEGMAVGLAVAAAGGDLGAPGALGLVVAMAAHNAVEGLVVAVPLREEGMPRGRSFLLGQASGLFEIAGGALGAGAVAFSATALPWGLALAAGAMLVVALGDVLPEARRLAPARVVAPSAALGALAMLLVERLGS